MSTVKLTQRVWWLERCRYVLLDVETVTVQVASMVFLMIPQQVTVLNVPLNVEHVTVTMQPFVLHVLKELTLVGVPELVLFANTLA